MAHLPQATHLFNVYKPMMERLYVLEEADTQGVCRCQPRKPRHATEPLPQDEATHSPKRHQGTRRGSAAEELLHILASLEALCSRHNQLTEAQIIEVVRRHRSKTRRHPRRR